MAKNDPRLALMAQNLSTRLEMECSLGATHIQFTLLDKEKIFPDGVVRAAETKTIDLPDKTKGPQTTQKPTPTNSTRPDPSPVSTIENRNSWVDPDEVTHPPKIKRKINTTSYPAVDGVPLGHTGNQAKVEVLAPILKSAQTCRLCDLCAKREQVVFGEGSLDADIVFIADAPGRDEDRSGRPVVGRSGQMLTRMIEGALKLHRKDVYITTIVKCRPPGNRQPRPDEISLCSEYLKQQIETIKPKIIVALGEIAGNAITGQNKTITELRENWHSFENIPVKVTFAPAFLLQQREREGRGNPTDHAALADLKEVVQKLT